MRPPPERSDILAAYKRFDTIDEYIETLSGWDMEIAQLEAGSFECHNTVVATSHCRYYFVRHDLQVLVKARNPGPDLQFYVPLSDRGKVNYLNVHTQQPTIAYVPVGHQVDSITPPQFDGVLIAVNPDHFYQLASDRFRQSNFDPLSPGRYAFPPSTPDLAMLRHTLEVIRAQFRIFQDGGARDDLAERVQLVTDLHIIPLLQSILIHATDDTPADKPQLLQSALHILLSNLDDPPSIRELAEILETSERNLQYLFKAHLGLSPKQLIRIYRLNEARRRLWKSDGQRGQVADIANQLGFWHMGYFAQDFKRLFKKNPSEILSMAPCSCGRGISCDCHD